MKATSTDTVVTREQLAVPIQRLWETLMFYEQIPSRPPLMLRWLLPVPLGTEGRKSQVGDEALCRYERGHLVKRVTLVEPGRRYAFEVTEQELDLGGGMRLMGGEYALKALDDGATEITLVTRYTGQRRPRWFWRPVEATVGHMFHRYILGSMCAAAKTDRVAIGEEQVQ